MKKYDLERMSIDDLWTLHEQMCSVLVKKITVALNRTGKIQTSTTMGIGGPVDPLAADQQKAQEFFNDQKHARLPDYTLSGKIIEARDRAGSIRQWRRGEHVRRGRRRRLDHTAPDGPRR